VSEDTTGITETTDESDSVTINELFVNKVENDEICNGLREQINAIIKWDKEVWDDIDSARN
jgi:hypothetical protein